MAAFGSHRARLAVSDAAKLTGLSRAAARRCLLTLEKLGYAEYDGKFFSLTARVLKLAHAYVISTKLPGLVQPVLEATSERIQEAASIAVLDGLEAVFIARSTTRRSLSAGLAIGSRLPAYCAATGRVLLSDLADDTIQRMLAQMTLRKLTPKTITDPALLIDEIRSVRTIGYAINEEELELGLRSIAVPVRDPNGRLVASMSIAAETSRVSKTQMVEQILPALEASRRMLEGML
jgi:IclR family pca regulon transcriptional regulator